MKWEMVKLGELVNILSGFAFDSNAFSDETGFPVIRIRDVKRGYTKTFYNSKYDPSFIISKGDMLIGMDGEFNIGVWKSDPALLNQRVCKIESSNQKRLDNGYLLHFLPFELKKIEDRASFVTVKHLSVKDIREISIPLPPLATQKRIAEILDKADALRQKDQALLRKYDELAQAVFVDMFGDPVRNEKGWEVKKLGDCIVRIQIGPFGTQLHESDYVQDGIPIINPMHMRDLKIHPNNKYTITMDKYQSLEQYWLKENDVIMARRGEMGRCALVTKQERGFLCGTGSLIISTVQSIINPFFLVYLLSRSSSRKALENIAAGTTMANLNKTIIQDFTVIVPPIEKQESFYKAINVSEFRACSGI